MPLIHNDFSPRDAEAFKRLTDHVGWTHTLADWRDFLALGQVWGHREGDGQVVSSAALFPFGEELASIGLVIVHSDYRGRGLARELMERCIGAAQVRTLTLIATPMGVPVYEGLSFRTISTVLRLVGTPQSVPAIESTAIKPLEPSRYGEIVALDEVAIGARRAALLECLLARAITVRGLSDDSGRLTGFGIALPKIGYTHIAPVVAPDVESAVALISALAAVVPQPVRVDVSRENMQLIRQLQSFGLEQTSEDPVMTLHGRPLPGRRALMHAISFQAFG